MRINTLAAVAAFISTSLDTTAPTAANTSEEDGVGFSAHILNPSAVVMTDGGSMVVEGTTFTIRASDGTVLTGAELAFRVDDFEFPIDATVVGRTATLTPVLDIARAKYKPVAQRGLDREEDAWTRMTSTIHLGRSVQAIDVGAGITSAILIGMFGPYLPAAAIGCMAGVLTLGALGGFAGTLPIGAPIAVAAAVQYFTTDAPRW